MKIILFILTSLTTLFSFTLNFDKTFETSLKPDTLRAFLSIKVDKKSEKDVLDRLSFYSKYFENIDDLDVKGGRYSIHPLYIYENSHRIKKGYSGEINYEISSNESKNINTLISKLQNEKNDKDVDITISQISWILNNHQKASMIDDLRLRAIKWSLEYTNLLSKDLKQDCSLLKLSLSNSLVRYPSPVMYEAKAIRSSIPDAPTPKQDIQKISINPHIEIECK